MKSNSIQLKVIPYYTGVKTLKSALRDKKSTNLLWLEILLNDRINWEDYLGIKKVKSSYEKACIWYTNFTTLLQNCIKRKPLKIRKKRFDQREHRKFLEVLSFVSS